MLLDSPRLLAGAGGVRQEGLSRALPLPPQMEAKAALIKQMFLIKL